MGTKMKGLLKGLRYITQIFDDEKEQEMQIGHPTDVKHVAHIGRDGPSVDSPSWMKDFNPAQGSQSAPLNVNGKYEENPEDSSRRSFLGSQNSTTKDLSELPKSSRRHSLTDGGSSTSESSTTRQESSSTKSRQSRRNSSGSSRGIRQPKGPGPGPESDSPSSESLPLPDIPKKSQRKKSKESVGGGGSSRSSRSKATIPPPAAAPYTSPFSDPGPDTKSIPGSNNNGELTHTSSLRPIVKKEGDKECNGIS